MGEGVVLYFLVLVFVCIFGYDGVDGLDDRILPMMILLDTLACMSLNAFL